MNKLPNEILIEIKEYVSFTPKNKEELKEAIELWCIKKKKAKKKYRQHITKRSLSSQLVINLHKSTHVFITFNCMCIIP